MAVTVNSAALAYAVATAAAAIAAVAAVNAVAAATAAVSIITIDTVTTTHAQPPRSRRRARRRLLQSPDPPQSHLLSHLPPDHRPPILPSITRQLNLAFSDAGPALPVAICLGPAVDPMSPDAGPCTLVDADIVDTSSPQSLAELRADVDATDAEYPPDTHAGLITLWVNVKPLADVRSPTLRRLAQHAALLGMRVSTCDVALIDRQHLRAISDAIDKLAAWRRRARTY